MAKQEVKLCGIKVPSRNERQTLQISPLHNPFSLERFSNKSFTVKLAIYMSREEERSQGGGHEHPGTHVGYDQLLCWQQL